MSNHPEWALVWSRKLTTSETETLQHKLRPLFAQGDEEDIQDIIDYAITVISNQKDIHYMVEEVAGMELEFCPPEVAQQMGKHVYDYLHELQTLETEKEGRPNTSTPTSAPEKSHVVSLKSSKGNALTMSGALGASREGGRAKSNSTQGALTSSRDRNDKDKKPPNRNKETDKGGRGERRDGKGLAFDRLVAKRNASRNRQSNGEEHANPRGRGDMRSNDGGGRRSGPRDGRGGRGAGRNERDSRGRGEREHRGGREHGGREHREHAGRGERQHGGRGERDIEDRGGRGGRGAKGGRDFRGGRNDEYDGRGRHSGARRKQDEEGFEDPGVSKRVRREEHNQSENYNGGYTEGYDESYEQAPHSGYKQAPWQSPAFRGRGRGRGGRFGRGTPGRGTFGNESYTENSGVDPEAVAVNPSPMVADTFGRGFAGRSSYRGRGFYAPAYDQVKNMMKAKTWVRKKEGEDSTNNGENGGSGAGDEQG
ncbi:hypothetical protein FisN_13Lh064 [Fistulifera solaris]|uniref:Uncharacterized protein n=1 Tax=Fistulifera solaris TaxID=1519565 RepID=A0A1Z5JF20_FISSO|nr:hypothetical protein FisN_13Lh064 [Fistulifera solaris]|eukprot:GAX12604.1 hypothetical protein FisN_13Lh064 [Fistulifera solaris]